VNAPKNSVYIIHIFLVDAPVHAGWLSEIEQ
jgi:hypothetical protein